PPQPFTGGEGRGALHRFAQVREGRPGVHRIDQALCDPIGKRRKNIAFVTKVLVDGGTRHSCPARDVGDGGLVEPLAGDDLEGSSEDLVPACFCPIRELLVSDLFHAVSGILTCQSGASVSALGRALMSRDAGLADPKIPLAGDRGQAPPSPGTSASSPGTVKPGSCSDLAGDRVCSAMDYARLGHSGLEVSRLCLGTMTLGRWGNVDPADCARIIRRALDEGVTFIDTANRYGMGESEEIVGMALEGRRAEAVVATKVFMPGP